MASPCVACGLFLVISIPFNYSDIALTVAEAMNVFRHVCFVSRIWRQNSSPGSLTFSHLGNRAEISHMNPGQKFIPVNGLTSRGHKKATPRFLQSF